MLTIDTEVQYQMMYGALLRHAVNTISGAILWPMFLGQTADVPVPKVDKSDWLCWTE